MATSRLSAIKRASVKFNWMRWVATVDIESCCPDEMDSLWRLKIMSFTQSAWEGIQLLFQLLPWWHSGVFRGHYRPAERCCPAVVCGETCHSVPNDFSSGNTAHTAQLSVGTFWYCNWATFVSGFSADFPIKLIPVFLCYMLNILFVWVDKTARLSRPGTYAV